MGYRRYGESEGLPRLNLGQQERLDYLQISD
jgi:hypothetical protein